MGRERHGLSIGIERNGDNVFMTMTAVGTLTHADYETITPMLESALNGTTQPEVRALVDLRQFNGWELRAAWDDFKLGLAHGRAFTKIAIVGNKPWEKVAARVGSWFVGGEIRYFEEMLDAVAWLIE